MRLKIKIITLIMAGVILTSLSAGTVLWSKRGSGISRPSLVSQEEPTPLTINFKTPPYLDMQLIGEILNPPAVRTYNPQIVLLEGKLIEATPVYVNETNAYFGHYWMLETKEQKICYLVGEANNLLKAQYLGQQMKVYGSWVSDTSVAGKYFPTLRVKFIEQ